MLIDLLDVVLMGLSLTAIISFKTVGVDLYALLDARTRESSR
jgi:hypothetical protein